MDDLSRKEYERMHADQWEDSLPHIAFMNRFYPISNQTKKKMQQ